MPDTLKRLLAHMEWADAAVLASFQAFTPPPRALELYAHILGAEHLWLARIRQRKPVHAVWPTLDVGQCANLARENAAAFRNLVEGITAKTLESEVAYVNSAGQPFTSRINDILLHVAMHGAYHRGQVAMLVREAGAKPASTDYIAFVRGAPTATRTPVR